jgi:diguanylate cyclase (GGDEF)-like protein
MNQGSANPHWIVRVNRQNRSIAFAMLFLIIGTHMAGQAFAPFAWGLLALQFLVYPQLMYWRARVSRDSRRAELNNMVVDSLLFGIWAAALGFPLWIAFTLFTSATIMLAAMSGLRGVAQSVAAIVCGVAVTVFAGGFHLSLDMGWPATLLCISGYSIYLVIIANVAYSRNIQLRDAREQLRFAQQARQSANEALQKQLDEIHVLQAQLRDQANRDPLTGLYNRRYLDSTLERELARCKREGQPLSLMLIDIDHFKLINDTYGHQAGDEVIKYLADMLSSQARAADVACRFGGEEFLLLLPNMPQDNALEKAEQWRSTFAATTIAFGEFHMQVTLSCGIATYPGHGTSPAELIRCSDQALYRAKMEGRNRVVVFNADLPATT